MKPFLYGALAALMLTSAASAASVTILVGKTNGTRTEVTPGPELPDTVIPGAEIPDTIIPGAEIPDTVVPGTPGKSKPYKIGANPDCLTTTILGPKGKKVPMLNVDANCNHYSLSDTASAGTPDTVIDNGFEPDTVIDNGFEPDTVIDGGYGPDVVTNVPTCTRKYKVVSTTPPYLSTYQTTSDGSC